MANKKPTNSIKTASVIPDDAYVTWGEDLSSKEAALKNKTKGKEKQRLTDAVDRVSTHLVLLVR